MGEGLSIILILKIDMGKFLVLIRFVIIEEKSLNEYLFMKLEVVLERNGLIR